ncbi:hypothetical protein GCM10009665_34830 [Kitasatospora nipponensis]|uniref:Secreted protein n=1 Tax=Kitasatospora nipponensis TaxID=258049 RepID=A0ABN1W8X5_9ACTN
MPPEVAGAPVVLVAAAWALPPEVSASEAPSSSEAAEPRAMAASRFGRRRDAGEPSVPPASERVSMSG